jgi:L-lysine exporter family protein LysE/ArgO
MTISTFITGFATGAALIIAIGAQNAFVLRQGILREHVFVVALICALSDAALIALGVGGVGTLITQTPALIAVATYGGAAFLAWYGFKAARRALASAGESLDATADGQSVGTLKSAVLACLAFTWLNPHVYLDTVVLLGSISAQYGRERWTFGAGAAMSSIVWFFGLAYGARLLAPIFKNPMAWRVLDAIIALVMFSIAISLLLR